MKENSNPCDMIMERAAPQAHADYSDDPVTHQAHLGATDGRAGNMALSMSAEVVALPVSPEAKEKLARLENDLDRLIRSTYLASSSTNSSDSGSSSPNINSTSSSKRSSFSASSDEDTRGLIIDDGGAPMEAATAEVESGENESSSAPNSKSQGKNKIDVLAAEWDFQRGDDLMDAVEELLADSSSSKSSPARILSDRQIASQSELIGGSDLVRIDEEEDGNDNDGELSSIHSGDNTTTNDHIREILRVTPPSPWEPWESESGTIYFPSKSPTGSIESVLDYHEDIIQPDEFEFFSSPNHFSAHKKLPEHVNAPAPTRLPTSDLSSKMDVSPMRPRNLFHDWNAAENMDGSSLNLSSSMSAASVSGGHPSALASASALSIGIGIGIDQSPWGTGLDTSYISESSELTTPINILLTDPEQNAYTVLNLRANTENRHVRVKHLVNAVGDAIAKKDDEDDCTTSSSFSDHPKLVNASDDFLNITDITDELSIHPPFAFADDIKGISAAMGGTTEYDGLIQFRLTDGNDFDAIVLIDSLPLQSYEISGQEVLVAKPADVLAKEAIEHASRLMEHLLRCGMLQLTSNAAILSSLAVDRISNGDYSDNMMRGKFLTFSPRFDISGSCEKRTNDETDVTITFEESSVNSQDECDKINTSADFLDIFPDEGEAKIYHPSSPDPLLKKTRKLTDSQAELGRIPADTRIPNDDGEKILLTEQYSKRRVSITNKRQSTGEGYVKGAIRRTMKRCGGMRKDLYKKIDNEILSKDISINP